MPREQDPAAWLRRPEVADVLAAARVAHLAVTTRHGPQVTPQAFAVAGGRVWMVTSRSSLKVRVVRRRPAVGVLVTAGGRSVVLSGRARVLSPWGAADAVRLLRSSRAVGEALLAYGAHNPSLLAGYAADLVRLPPPLAAIPVDRVLLVVEVERGFLAEAGGGRGVAAARRQGLSARTGPAAAELPGAVPAEVVRLARRRSAAVVGWPGTDGPLALPALWDPATGTARIAAPVAAAAGLVAAAAPACVALDDSAGGRPTRFAGLVLRGDSRLTLGRDGAARVDVSPRLVTWWQGFATRTVAVAAEPAAPGGVAAQGPTTRIVTGGRRPSRSSRRSSSRTRTSTAS